MNTDDLIDFLATHVEAVDPRRQDRIVLVAVGASLVLAALAAAAVLGLRGDLMQAVATPGFALKIAFLVSLVAIALQGLRRAVRAGRKNRALLYAALVPLGLIWLAAGLQLSALVPGQWLDVVMFREWRLCVVAIPLLSLLPLGILALVLREAVPTELPYCGALLGLAAGGIGALGYAAYCLNDTPVYVGIWYAVGIAIVTAIGWLLGPRLLRW